MYFSNEITMVTREQRGAVRVIQREIGLSGTQTGTPWGDWVGGNGGKLKRK